MGCGEIRFLDGGLIQNARIIASTLVECALSHCTFDSGTITNLLNIDTVSANKILDALCGANQDKINEFAKLILNALSSVDKTPDSTEASSLPTTIFGDSRVGIMGAPDKWIQLGDYLIPAYSIADGKTEANTFNLNL